LHLNEDDFIIADIVYPMQDSNRELDRISSANSLYGSIDSHIRRTCDYEPMFGAELVALIGQALAR